MSAELTAAPARSGARWPWFSLLPIGLGAWAPAYAGVRARRPLWVLLGAVWIAIALAGWIGSSTSHRPGHDDVAGMLMVVAWLGGAVTSFTIRGDYERRMAASLLPASEDARLRLEARSQARELAQRDPLVAVEMGIGRPDRAGAADGGVVDVNNAPASTLLGLPGVDDALATRIVEARAQTGGFRSVEDLGEILDLDAGVVEELRDRTVFLPRDAAAH